MPLSLKGKNRRAEKSFENIDILGADYSSFSERFLRDIYEDRKEKKTVFRESYRRNFEAVSPLWNKAEMVSAVATQNNG